MLVKTGPPDADETSNQTVATIDDTQSQINVSIEEYLKQKLGNLVKQASSYTPFKVVSMLFFHVPYTIQTQSISKFTIIQYLDDKQ